MPRNYHRKNADTFDVVKILAAIKLVKGNPPVGVRAAATSFGVSHSTLLRYIKRFDAQFPPAERNFDNITDDEAKSFLLSCSVLGAKPLFDATQEKELVRYIIRCSKLNYGLTINNIRRLAFEFAQKCKLPYPTAAWNQTGTATKDWYYGFMGRHRNLSLRTPDSTSMNRAKGFCKENVDEFFANYKVVLDETPFTQDRIWNVDEKGFPTVPKHAVKVVARKGAKHVGQQTGGERGVNVTVICGVNAAGHAIPPMFLFPRKNMKAIFMDNAPPGAEGRANGSGWITSIDFEAYMRHFIKYTSASKTNPLLLLMDNHSCHITIEIIDLCIDNGITIVTFPPHCTHRMQPLDVGVFGPAERAYNVNVQEWTQTYAGRTYELHHVAGVVDKTLLATCTPLNIRKGFEASGIYPVNSNKFTDDDFLLANISGENLMAEEEPAEDEDRRQILVNFDNEEGVAANEEVVSTEPSDVASTSTATTSAASLRSTLVDIGPVQFAEARAKSNRGRKPMHSAILTSPQNRAEAKQKADKRAEAKQKADKRAKNIGKRAKTTPSPRKRRASVPAPKRRRESSEESDGDEDRDFCLVCLKLLPKKMDRFNSIHCDECDRPFHLRCVNMGNHSYYTCDECLKADDE